MNRPTIITVAAALAVSLLLAACGGDDDSGGTGTPSPTINTSLDAATVQEFRDLTAKWADASAKITYTFMVGPPSSMNEARVIVYRKTPNMRIDHIAAARTNIVIVRTNLGYSCIDSGLFCGQLSPEEAIPAAQLVPFVSQLGNGADVDAMVNGLTKLELAADQEVIGRPVKCFNVSGDLRELQGDATFCFTEDGLLLSVAYDGGAQALQLTGTAIEGVKDTDFEPPYPLAAPPVDIPTASP